MNHQRQHLKWLSKRYPNIWEEAEKLRREERHHWPDWCYLPLRYWIRLLVKLHPNIVNSTDDAGRLLILGAWRTTQGIYRFDPDLYASLIKTPLTGDLPYKLLYRLPSWGIYIETPGLCHTVKGVYACLSWDAEDGDELYLIWDSSSFQFLAPFLIPLGHGSLVDCLQPISKKVDANTFSIGIEKTASVISLLLYLCSEEADYERRPISKGVQLSSNGKPRITNVPEIARVWDVGVRVGAALRKAQQVAEAEYGNTPNAQDHTKFRTCRPHWRRAHWHTYYTGPKNGERTPLVKWLPPVAVKLDGQSLPTVIHHVNSESD